MEAVLIYTETSRIAESKDFLNRSVTYMQELHDQFKLIGITLTLQKLADVTSLYHRSNNKDGYIRGVVSEELLTLAGTPDFNGVPINRDKLKEMLEIPDLTAIKASLESLPYGLENNHIEPGLLQITTDVISRKDTSYATLEARHTHYSRNDKGAEMATILFDLAAKLNSWGAYLAPSLGARVTNEGIGQVEGLEFWNGAYRPILRLIREKEDLYPHYTVEEE